MTQKHPRADFACAGALAILQACTIRTFLTDKIVANMVQLYNGLGAELVV